MAYNASQHGSSRTFLQRLGLYLTGIAIGFLALGYFAAKRRQAASRLQPAAATDTLGGAWTPENLAATRASGETIAEAIGRYRAERAGTLPSRLEDLTAGYLPEIPAPAAGDSPWRYVVSEDGTFYYLSFGEGLGQAYDRPKTGHLDARDGVWRIIGPDGVEHVEPLGPAFPQPTGSAAAGD